MEDEFLSNDIFVSMMRVHGGEILDLLIAENINFSIVANLEGVFFEPPLPDKITRNFRPMIRFDLANYTLSSAKVYGKMLQFETGFGSGHDIIGTLVSVRLESILQISIQNEPIFLNHSIPKSFAEELEELQQEQKEEQKEEKLNKSLKAFMQNPENKKLFD